MATRKNIYEEYLYRGSPLYPSVEQKHFEAIYTYQKNNPLELAIIIVLDQILLQQMLKLRLRRDELARLGTTEINYDQYEKGFAATLRIVLLAHSKRIDNREVYDILLGDIMERFGESYTKFIEGKVDECVTFLEIAENIEDNAKVWERIFVLAVGYDSSDYYRVGLTVSEVTFQAAKNSINRAAQMTQ